MAWGALAASIGKGLPGRVRTKGKPRRKLTTSEAAIRRAEARKRGRGSSGPSRGPSRPSRGGTGRPTTRTINTGSKGGRRRGGFGMTPKGWSVGHQRRRKAHCK